MRRVRKERSMASRSGEQVECRRLELDGIRYVILKESVFESLCERAGLDAGAAPDEHPLADGLVLDPAALAEKLVRRRRAAGLSQAELARQAGIRPETLNRIERGRTEPDFATIRKLVTAMKAAEKGGGHGSGT